MIELAKVKLFSNPFTLRFNDLGIQNQYSKDQYDFRFMIAFSLLLFLASAGLLSFTIINLMNKELEFSLLQLLIILIPTFLLLITCLECMYYKNTKWAVNLNVCIICNLSLYCIAEHFKFLLWKYWLTKIPVFYVDLLHILIRTALTGLLDSRFINQICCFVFFVPFYFCVFINEYSNPENEEAIFIILLTVISFISLVIDRKKKQDFYKKLVHYNEKRKNLDVMNNVQSGYIIYDIENQKLDYNKVYEKRLAAKLLNNFNFKEEVLKELKIQSQEIEPQIKNSESQSCMSRLKLKIRIVLDKLKKHPKDNSEEQSHVKINDEENEVRHIRKDTRPNQISLRIVLNSLFHNCERVNAHDFDGEFKKTLIKISDEQNPEGGNKIQFFKTLKTSLFKKKNEAPEKKVPDQSSFNSKEIIDGQAGNCLNESKVDNLYSEEQLFRLLSIIVKYPDTASEFKYLASKRIRIQDKDILNAAILVRYDKNTSVIEFLINEHPGETPQTDYQSNAHNKSVAQVSGERHSLQKDRKDLFETLTYNSKLVIKQLYESLENQKNINYSRSLVSLFQIYLNDFSTTSNMIHKKVEKLTNECISIDSFIGHLSELIETKALLEKRQIKIKTQIASSVPDKIMTDHKKLQMLIFYCVNASICEASQGSVLIGITLKSNRKKAYEVVIIDDCCTISEDLMKSINLNSFDELYGVDGGEQKETQSRRICSLNSVFCNYLKVKHLAEIFNAGLFLERISTGGIKTTITLSLISSDEDLSHSKLLESPSISDYLNTETNKESCNRLSFKKSSDNFASINFNLNIDQENKEKTPIPEGTHLFIIADQNLEIRSDIIRKVSARLSKENISISCLEAYDGAEVLNKLLYAFENNLYVEAIIFDESMSFISGPVLAELLKILKKRAVIPDEIKLFMTADHDYSSSAFTNEIEILSKNLDSLNLGRMTEILFK